MSLFKNAARLIWWDIKQNFEYVWDYVVLLIDISKAQNEEVEKNDGEIVRKKTKKTN